jgi:S1-C subfamily serine protease
MNLATKLAVGLISSIFFSFPLSSNAIALEESEIKNIAKKVTVNIAFTGTNFEKVPIASGVLIVKNGDTYYMLTNNHVLKNSEDVNYYVFTSDGRVCKLKVIKKHGQDPDLAEASFSANDCSGEETGVETENITLVTAGGSQFLKKNSSVYVAGWPIADSEKRSEVKFTYGRLINDPIEKIPLTYSNDIENGMSGGPVFNQEGQLIGINFARLGEDVKGGRGISIETINETVITEQIKTALEIIVVETPEPETPDEPESPVRGLW